MSKQRGGARARPSAKSRRQPAAPPSPPGGTYCAAEGPGQGFSFLPEAAPSHCLTPSLLAVLRPLHAPGPTGRRGREQVGRCPPHRGWGSLKGSGPGAGGTPSPQRQHACLHAGHKHRLPGPQPALPRPCRAHGQQDRPPRAGAVPSGTNTHHPGGCRHGNTARGLLCPKTSCPETNLPRTASWVGRSLASILSACPPPFPPPSFFLSLNIHTKPQSKHKNKVKVRRWTREGAVSPLTHIPLGFQVSWRPKQKETGLDVSQMVGQGPGLSEAGWTRVTCHSESERCPPPPRSTLATGRISLSKGQSCPLHSEGDPCGLTDNDTSHTRVLLF